MLAAYRYYYDRKLFYNKMYMILIDEFYKDNVSLSNILSKFEFLKLEYSPLTSTHVHYFYICLLLSHSKIRYY